MVSLTVAKNDVYSFRLVIFDVFWIKERNG